MANVIKLRQRLEHQPERRKPAQEISMKQPDIYALVPMIFMA